MTTPPAHLAAFFSKVSFDVGSNMTSGPIQCHSYRLDIGCFSDSTCVVNVLGAGNVTRPSDHVSQWQPCSNVEISERIAYDDVDFNPMTGDLTVVNPPVGFFKLVRKVVIYTMIRGPGQESIAYISKEKIKITPGTSKFPLKSTPLSLEDAQKVNFVRVKIIGNRVAKGSKSGNKAHPYWECVEKPYQHQHVALG